MTPDVVVAFVGLGGVLLGGVIATLAEDQILDALHRVARRARCCRGARHDRAESAGVIDMP